MIALAAVCTCGSLQAQQLPRKVRNVELQDLDGKKTKMPWWGEKNLLIFYVDPDKAKQNHDFTVELETNHRASGPNIEGFGIINLKDSWYPVPNSTVRAMAKKRTAKNGATILCDPDRWLRMASGRLQRLLRADAREQRGRAGLRPQGRAVGEGHRRILLGHR